MSILTISIKVVIMSQAVIPLKMCGVTILDHPLAGKVKCYAYFILLAKRRIPCYAAITLYSSYAR